MKVVKMLLGREEVIPDKQDNDGRTPLSYAAEHGFEGAVGMLLGREEVDPNKPDNLRRTPFTYATCSAHEVVLTLLQSHKSLAPLVKRKGAWKRRGLCTDTLSKILSLPPSRRFPEMQVHLSHIRVI